MCVDLTYLSHNSKKINIESSIYITVFCEIYIENNKSFKRRGKMKKKEEKEYKKEYKELGYKLTQVAETILKYLHQYMLKLL